LLSNVGHKNQICGLHLHSGELFSIAMDNSLRKTQIKEGFIGDTTISTLDTMPKQFDCDDKGKVFIISPDSITLIEDNVKKLHLSLSFSATSIAVTKNGTQVAIGANDGKLHLFDILSKPDDKIQIQEFDICQNLSQGAIVSLAFNTDGTMLAMGNTNSAVVVYNLKTKQFLANNWVFHNACVNLLLLSPSQRYIASASLDTHIYIWSLDKPGSRICIRRAHRESVVGIRFIKEDLLASVGQDASLKTWHINYN